VPLLSVDCDAQPSVCDDYGVDSPPNIQLFQRGVSLAVYQGPRRAGAIANFVARWQRDVVTVLGSAEELASFKTADETVFVAYLAEGDDEVEARRAFDRVAEAFRAEFSFGVVTDPALWAAQSVQGPAVVCYKLVDGDTVTFSSSFTEDGALEKFVVEASRPVISELTTLNHQRLLDVSPPNITNKFFFPIFSPSSTMKLVRLTHNSVPGPWSTSSRPPRPSAPPSASRSTASRATSTPR
jgi:protein disulfide-isomerase A1